MRAIKVTFRAVFQQPIGPLNPMGLKLPGDIPVEVFGAGGNWQARDISRIANAFTRLGKFSSAEHGKAEVTAAFERQVQDWQIWGRPPQPPSAPERILTPYEIADLGQGKWGWIQDEDRTHIIHAQSIPPGARIPPAACGAQVNAKCFISTKANVEPSCKGCAEVWKKEYRDK